VRIVAAAGRKQRRVPSPADEQRRKAAIALIERYDARLRRTARRNSLCAADAEDAYQRALEILLEKAPDVEAQRLVRWMHTVTRHEAYAVRRQRERLLTSNRTQTADGTEIDTIDLFASDAPEPDVGAERSERTRRGYEALSALKPQEIRALTLKAEGYSYEEIGEITGFSRTKINRCMVEGRKHFLRKFAEIEEGVRCDELTPSLSAFADGELDEEARRPLVNHLEGCAHCRAKLRDYRSAPRKILSLAPVAALGGPSLLSRAGDRIHHATDRTREIAGDLVHRTTGAMDASQTVAAGGGSRGSGLALLGVVCGIGAGGGAAYCVDQNVLPNPLGHDRPAKQSDPPAAASADASAGDADSPVIPPAPPVLVPPVGDPVPPAEREFGVTSKPNKSGGTREFGGSAPAAAPASSGSGPGSGGSGGSGDGGSSGGGKEGFGF
jgi:RNA polymerase sigma factor (sigma-70 family)